MRFGPVPLAEAEGAILAHTYRIGGKPIVKGTRLDAAQVAQLASAGVSEVTVARLDADDVHEDEAAAAVAAALAGPTLRAHRALTGRANLYATGPGVLIVDAVGVDDVNLVHESITLGTLAPWSLVEAGDMVATVKVIPFASPQHVVSACVARSAGLVSIQPLRRHTAGLVATRLVGSPDRQIANAIEAQRSRLERHGSRLGRVIECEHRVDALVDALRDLLKSGCSPLLLVGASATVDRNDVLPTALREVGGAVEHLGMPMDPGNQLFMGRVGDVAAIGVPGCARSTKPGGFDVVLRRVLAGSNHRLATTLCALGVGGLDESTKRREPSHAPDSRVVVLAAGQSRRMGAGQQTARVTSIGGQPMVDSGCRRPRGRVQAVEIVVVTGHQEAEVRDALAGRPVRFVHNPSYREGMSTSLRAGFEALGADASLDGALVALGDMPFVREQHHIDALIGAYDPAEGVTICVPVRGRKRGHPVLWGRRHFDEMRGLTGDEGARSVLAANGGAVAEVSVEDDAVFMDLDTPEAVAAVKG